MSNSKDRMIVFASILGAILATGLLALNPSILANAQAMPYGSGDYDDRHFYGDQYGYDSNYYYQDDNRYSYDKKDPKSSHTDIQKIKCINSNININGVDVNQIPQDNNVLVAANERTTEGANTQNGNGFADRINLEKNLVNFCINDNDNSQERQQQSESNGLTVGSLYIVEGPLVNSQAPNPTTSIAECDAGDFVISGGFNWIPLAFQDFAFVSLTSNPTPTLDGWSASFQSVEANQQIQATAVCFDTP